MIHSICNLAIGKSCSLGAKDFRREVPKPKNKATNVFIRSHSNKLNTSEHFCMAKSEAKERIKDEPDNVPAGVAIGLVEIFAGALACILPIPGARVAGGILIGDGVRRVADEGVNLDQENRGGRMWPSEVPRPIKR